MAISFEMEVDWQPCATKENFVTSTELMFQAVDELFKLMQLFVTKYPDSTEQELHEIDVFRKQTMQLYLQVISVIFVGFIRRLGSN